jgi:hypothetical protein
VRRHTPRVCVSCVCGDVRVNVRPVNRIDGLRGATYGDLVRRLAGFRGGGVLVRNGRNEPKQVKKNAKQVGQRLDRRFHLQLCIPNIFVSACVCGGACACACEVCACACAVVRVRGVLWSCAGEM